MISATQFRFTGATGSGKSYLAQALGMNACFKQFRVIHYNTSKLIKKLKLARIEGGYAKFTEKIDRCDLLILDDFGLSIIDANKASIDGNCRSKI